MVKQAPKKKNKKKNAFMPVIGIVLALTFGFFSYLLVPPVDSYLQAQGVATASAMVGIVGPDSAPVAAQVVIGAVLFFLMFGTAMFLVSLLAGRTYDEDLNLKHKKESARRRQAMLREKEERRRHRRNANREQ